MDPQLDVNRSSLELAIAGSRGGMWSMRFAGDDPAQMKYDQVYCSPQIKAFIGFTDEQFPNSIEAWQSRILPEDLVRVRQDAKDHLEGKTALHDVEYRIRHKDGSMRWIHSCGKIQRDEHGVARAWNGVGWDITQRRCAEAALRESELRLKAVLTSTLDPMVCIGTDGLIQFVSNSVERVFGWQTQELIGKNVNILIPQPYLDAHANAMLNYRRTGKTSILENPREMLAARKDGSTFSCEVTIWRVDVPGRDEPLITGIIRDVTDRKAAQELLRRQTTELEHASRLTMAGQMAAAMAHELSQPLGAIANYIGAGLRGIQSSESLTKQQLAPFNDAMEQVQHAGQIIRRTLSFLRRGQTSPISVAVNHEVHQAVLLMLAEARYRGVTIEEHFGDDLPTVQADSLHIRQVVSNLLRNAIESIDAAMSIQRSITIHTSCDAQRHVTVMVNDSGPGVDQEISRGAFEAFRTSKREGLGLGLWICRNILQSYQGDITLAPSENGGASFQFWLPAETAPKE